MKKITVLGPGTRGNHGCSEVMELEGELRALTVEERKLHYPNTHIAIGKVMKVDHCPYCSSTGSYSTFSPETGEDVEYTGWLEDETTLQL